MKSELMEVLKVISNNRIELIKCLTEPKTHTEICRTSNLSPSTVSRCLNLLQKYGIVNKNEDKYVLTGIGYFLMDYLDNLNEVVEFDFLKKSSQFAKFIPAELKPGIVTLKTAEKFEKPYEVVPYALKDFERMHSYALFADGIVAEELIRLVWIKCMGGVRVRAIMLSRSFKKKITTGVKVIKMMEAEGYSSSEVISALRTNLKVKVAELPIQLGILDGKVVYFQVMPDNTLESPAYISRDRKCILWAENLFEHCWIVADPADYVSKLEKNL
ncbi:MAG: hypothetical protein DSY33_02175 [Archaeoglobus sp.]|nr:MAG: hypothetical protein DSY33_02175 [Archaeoglobus sp.]